MGWLSYRQLLSATESAFRAKGCSTLIREEVLMAKCQGEGEELAFLLERDVEGYVRLSLLTDLLSEGLERKIFELNFLLYGVKIFEDPEGFVVFSAEIPEDCLHRLGIKQLDKEAERLAAAFRRLKASGSDR